MLKTVGQFLVQKLESGFFWTLAGTGLTFGPFKTEKAMKEAVAEQFKGEFWAFNFAMVQ